MDIAQGGIQEIGGVQALAGRYKGVLLDQFGVLHNGQEPYPAAHAAVRLLAESGLKILLLSNSSRRSSGVLAKLAKMGFDPAHFAGVVTSGEVAFTQLSQRQGDFWQALGRRCLHITWGDRGAISLAGLGLEVTDDPETADFILAHGTEALGCGDGIPPRSASLGELASLLQRCAASERRIPMIVANPDLVTVDGAALRVMPGTLAKQYADAGGEVHLMGKPASVIYEAAMQMLGLGVEEVLAIGDSLEHDIAGAANAGVASAFVCGGIHADETLDVSGQGTNTEGLERLCQQYGVRPTFSMPFFQP